MRCAIWRQHRGQLFWAAAVVFVYGLFILVVGHSANAWLGRYQHWLAQLRAAGCPLPIEGSGRIHVPSETCRTLLAQYRGGVQPAFGRAFNFAIPVFEEGLPLLLVLIGVLVGAPVVAREVEQRTQLVAWTQSVARRHWYTTKAIALSIGLAGVGLIVGVANDRLQIPLSAGGLTSSRWPWFFSIDLAPAAEAVVAFAIAVAIGAWLRRTLPAIGAALVAFLAVFLLSGWAVRTLTPLSRSSGPRGEPRDSWLIGGGLYHPAGQYWPLQVTFVAMLLALAALILAAGWRATRARATV